MTGGPNEPVVLDTRSFLANLVTQGRVERLAQVALILMGVLAVFVTLYVAKSFLLPTTLGIIIAFMGTPVSNRLEDWHLPRYAAAGLTTVVLVLGVLIALLALLPAIQEWGGRLPEISDRLKNDLRGLRDVVAAVEHATKEVQETVESVAKDSTGEPEPQAVVVAEDGMLSRMASIAPSLVAMSAYTVLLAFFLIAERQRVRAFALRMPRNFQTRLRLARTFQLMRSNVASYLFTVATINFGLGIVAGAMFYAIGLPNAGLWGAGVAIANFVPFIGPVLMQLVVFVVGYVSFDSLHVAIIAPLALAALNFTEGNLITPAIVGKRSRLRPLTVFVAIAFGAWIWGIGGAFVAVPVTIVLWTLCQGVLLAPTSALATRREKASPPPDDGKDRPAPAD